MSERSPILFNDHGHYTNLFACHKHVTLTYCFVYCSFGMCIAFLGPALWDLSCQTGSTLEQTTWVFLIQTLSSLIGSMAAGLLLQRLPAKYLTVVSLFVASVSFLLIPTCQSLRFLAVILAVLGFHMGILDTTANISLINLYKEDVGPFLQMLYFFYAVGAFLSPIIIEPFLENIDCTKFIVGNGTRTNFSKWTKDNLRSQQSITLKEAQENVNIHVPFFMMASLQLPIIVAALVNLSNDNGILEGCSKGKYENLDSSQMEDNNEFVSKPIILFKIVALASTFAFVADGLQGMFGALVFTFSRLADRDIEASQAANVNAVFWGFLAAGRLLAIFVLAYFSPRLLMIGNLVCLAISAGIYVFTPISFPILCAATAVFGLSLASTVPTILSMAQQRIDIGAISTSCIVMGSALGDMVYAPLVGNLMYEFGANAFLAATSISVLAMPVIFFSFIAVGSKTTKTPERAHELSAINQQQMVTSDDFR